MSILVTCPNCHRGLKLPDRRFLGRTGKCPKCGHSFVLQEASDDPGQTDAQITDSPGPNLDVKHLPADNAEQVSSNFTPRIRADEIPAESIQRKTSVPEKPVRPRTSETLARREPRPPETAIRREPRPEKLPRIETPIRGSASQGTDDSIEPESAHFHSTSPPEATSNVFPDFASITLANNAAQPMVAKPPLQQRKVRYRNFGLILAGIIGSGVLATVGLMFQSARHNSVVPVEKSAANDSDQPLIDEGKIDDVAEAGTLDPSQTEYALMGSPTHGKPIELRYMPFGTQVVLNLHPAAIWKDQGLGELRGCLPPLADFLESTLKDLFACRPDEVNELLICLIPGVRGTAPGVAAVAHLVDDQDRNRLIDRLKLHVDADRTALYVAGQRAYLIVDSGTLAVCPLEQSDEMIQAIDMRHPVEQLDPLLRMTDRDRHLSVVFTPLTLALQDSWFTDNLRPLVKSGLEWLTDEVETVSWSFHLTDELFHSEIVLRNKQGSANKLKKVMRKQFSELAGRLVPLFQRMDPRASGPRLLIGRFPAMVEVYSMATIFNQGPRHIQLTTPLPHKAAANLFLGAYLAWDESTRTDFSQAKPIPSVGPQLPVTVVARLDVTLDVDFRSAPMTEAFAFISGEIQTPIDLDGDAIKAGGFTKNLKQSFRMDAASVKQVIARIFVESKSIPDNPEKHLVVVVDEDEKKLLITTQSAAVKRGLKPFDVR